MIVAFKQAAATPDLANQVIGYWTESDWVHCEMLLMHPRRLAVSSRVDGGVTAITWGDLLTNPDQWELYWVPITNETDVWDFLAGEMGKGFNWVGLLAGHVAKIARSQPDQWFCSELTYAVLQQFSLLDLPQREPARVSPADLRSYVLDNACQQVFINDLTL